MKRIEVVSPMIGSSHGMPPRNVAHDEQGDEERERQEDVGDAHHDVVEQPAAQAGDRSDGDPDDGREDRRREADHQRDPQAGR